MIQEIRMIIGVIVVLIVFSTDIWAQENSFAGGSGTEEDPYQVENVEQLQEIRNYTDAHFIQIADIDASETENWNDGRGFRHIGEDGLEFEGSYDGDGYKIADLTVNRPDAHRVGLFGHVEGYGELENIVLENVSITGSSRVGGLAGDVREEVKVTDVVVEGNIEGGANIGGLIGTGRNKIVMDSHVNVVVNGGTRSGGLIGDSWTTIIRSSAKGLNFGTGRNMGGLVGYIRNGEVIDSFSKVNVHGDGADRVGGLVGQNNGFVQNSYAYGNVSGDDYVGGLVGSNVDGGEIISSYSVGEVAGNIDTGGFIGINGEEVDFSYWDSEASGIEEAVGSGEDEGITALSTEEMSGIEAFEHMEDFDFGESSWLLTENYPALYWEDVDAITPPPEEVVLFEPQDGAEDQSIQPEFSWNEEERSDEYTLQVSKDEDFSNLTIDQKLSETTFTPETELDFETTYFWKVEAENESGTSESEIWSFTTRPELPESIVLIEPKKDTTNVSLQPSFVWQEDGIADTYKLQITKDEQFETLVVDSTGIEDTSITLQDSLEYLSTYYWRVRGIGVEGEGEWSETWAFTTIIDEPGLVELTSPADDSEGILIQPELTWKQADRAETYQIQIDTDSEFDSPAIDIEDIEGTEFTLQDSLQFNTDYYWRARAVNVGGESEWSTTWSFFTEFALDTPVLASPEDETEDISIPVTFQWQPVDEAKDYQLQIASDENFENVLDFSGSESEHKSMAKQTEESEDWTIAQEVDGLDFSTEYFWRVKATGEEGESDWSDPRSLATEEAPLDGMVELTSPDDEAGEVSIPTELSWEAFEEDATYHIEVSHTQAFDTSLVVKDYKDTEIEIKELVTDTTTFHWRVQAEVDGQLTAWSETWSFTTELRPPEVPEWQPEDGADDVETDLLVEWSEAERAETYNLQLAEDEEFNDLVVDEEGLEATEFQASELEPGTTYHWRVEAANEAGGSGWSEALSFTTEEVVSAGGGEEVPDEFALGDNYPNPFNPDTRISYQLAENAEVTLRVYDTLGREVTTLVNTHQSAGKYEVSFDASNLSSGTYIYRIEAGGFVESRQMMLVK